MQIFNSGSYFTSFPFAGPKNKHPNDCDKGVPVWPQRPSEPAEGGGEAQDLRLYEPIRPPSVLFGPLPDPRRQEESLHHGRRVQQRQGKLALWKVSVQSQHIISQLSGFISHGHLTKQR